MVVKSSHLFPEVTGVSCLIHLPAPLRPHTFQLLVLGGWGGGAEGNRWIEEDLRGKRDNGTMKVTSKLLWRVQWGRVSQFGRVTI